MITVAELETVLPERIGQYYAMNPGCLVARERCNSTLKNAIKAGNLVELRSILAQHPFYIEFSSDTTDTFQNLNTCRRHCFEAYIALNLSQLLMIYNSLDSWVTNDDPYEDVSDIIEIFIGNDPIPQELRKEKIESIKNALHSGSKKKEEAMIAALTGSNAKEYYTGYAQYI